MRGIRFFRRTRLQANPYRTYRFLFYDLPGFGHRRVRGVALWWPFKEVIRRPPPECSEGATGNSIDSDMRVLF
jgi:hypothetical protein